MTQFMVLYRSTVSAKEIMENTTPEQAHASMADWLAWRDEASKTFKIEFGLPLQGIGTITPEAAGDSQSHVTGYSIAEGESRDKLLELFPTHPHLKSPGASIDVFEMLDLPIFE